MTFTIKAAHKGTEGGGAENIIRDVADMLLPAHDAVHDARSDTVRIAVIGGGPAGMRAAAAAAYSGAFVTLFEKNKILGRKLRITGKGRCNITNDCAADEFMANIPVNPRFLWSALDCFSTEDTKLLFERLGVPLKTERGKRVFPVSDLAGDIAGAMVRDCRAAGVDIKHEKVISLVHNLSDEKITGITTETGKYDFDRVIVCTGGLSYPLTGSDGDGYRFARDAGHKITAVSPSLVPIECDGDICARLQGLSLRNVGFKIVDTQKNKVIYEDFGEMLFTHFGISGPMALSASAHIGDPHGAALEARIDLKPALDERMLDNRLLSDFTKYANRNFENALYDLLPSKMIPVVVELSGIDPAKRVNSITREERRALISLLKCFTVRPRGLRPIDEAIITRGGVNVKEINPGTMESKLVRGLFFAGEIIDTDGYTGGFNLQIALSTGTLAGQSAARVF